MIVFAAGLVFLWACWLGWRWWQVIDPAVDGIPLRDEGRWLALSVKWLALFAVVVLVLRTGCVSCEGCAEIAASTSGESWRLSRSAGEAEFWRTWREMWDVVLGVF